MELFYVITMYSKRGKRLFLESIDGKFVWTFKKDDAIHFDTDKEAEKFAKGWFKKFNEWEIEESIIKFR